MKNRSKGIKEYKKLNIASPNTLTVPQNYTAYLKGKHHTKIKADITVIELNQPKGAFLVIEYPQSAVDCIEPGGNLGGTD